MIDSSNACLFGGIVVTNIINEYTYSNDTYIYRIISRTWIKINFNQKDSILPCERAAHTAAVNDNKQMVIYGGSNKFGLADDKLWILNLGDKNEGIWSEIKTIGPTPGPRYGHSLIFLKPFFVLFGGEISLNKNLSNELWIINVKILFVNGRKQI